MENFKKVVILGTGTNGKIYVTIDHKGNNLSISGVEGPKPNGDCKGSCGQIGDSIRENLGGVALGLTSQDIEKLLAIWEVYHLNDTKPDCEHQRLLNWSKKPIDSSKPLNAYGRHFEGQKTDSWNMLAWVTRKEHPQGLLGEPCPICGYKYGTAWKRMEVPEDVLQWLKDLPNFTDKIGTWFN